MRSPQIFLTAILQRKHQKPPVLGLFNREIITYTIGSRPTFSLVSDMLEKALERLPEGPLAINAFGSGLALSNEAISPYASIERHCKGQLLRQFSHGEFPWDYEVRIPLPKRI